MFQNIKDIRSGDVRAGVIRNVNGQYYADVGLAELVLLDRRKYQGIKINVKITSTKPVLRGVEAENCDITKYWGYEVFEAASLTKLTQILPSKQVVFTSKKGRVITNANPEIVALKSSENVLLVFGSPTKGVNEILASEGERIKSSSLVINMFPMQSTRTVRLEEAILGSLAIFNYILSSR
jgi:predicted SPOUT superfamily RNA methylase MTH1